MGPAVPEICSQTDRHTHTQTDEPIAILHSPTGAEWKLHEIDRCIHRTCTPHTPWPHNDYPCHSLLPQAVSSNHSHQWRQELSFGELWPKGIGGRKSRSGIAEQVTDTVYGFWLQKLSKFENFRTIRCQIHDQSVSWWGLSDNLWGFGPKPKLAPRLVIPACLHSFQWTLLANISKRNCLLEGVQFLSDDFLYSADKQQFLKIDITSVHDGRR